VDDERRNGEDTTEKKEEEEGERRRWSILGDHANVVVSDDDDGEANADNSQTSLAYFSSWPRTNDSTKTLHCSQFTTYYFVL